MIHGTEVGHSQSDALHNHPASSMVYPNGRFPGVELNVVGCCKPPALSEKAGAGCSSSLSL